MREVVVLFLHLIVTVARRARPGGLGSVVAESIRVKHQRLILNGGRKRAPHRRAPDRILAGWWTLFIRRVRVFRSATVLRPSPLVRLHDLLGKPKYRMLFSAKGRSPAGPQGTQPRSARRNRGHETAQSDLGLSAHCPAHRVGFRCRDRQGRGSPDLEHSLPAQTELGGSILADVSRSRQALWSCDLFRCESAPLRTYWVRVGMDQFTRRVIGFGVPPGTVDGPALSRMFRRAIRGQGLPKYLSADQDPLDRFHPGQANLRVLEVTEVQTVPYVPLAPPLVERLSGTIRREYLDRILVWSTAHLEAKLIDFQHYYHAHRTPSGWRDDCRIRLRQLRCR